MENDEKIEFVRKVFTALFENRDTRLQRGQKLRQQIADAIAQGKVPTGYRVDWLKNSAMELIRVLQDVGHQFNLDYPDDQISTQDLCDVLETAKGMIKKVVAKANKDSL